MLLAMRKTTPIFLILFSSLFWNCSALGAASSFALSDKVLLPDTDEDCATDVEIDSVSNNNMRVKGNIEVGSRGKPMVWCYGALHARRGSLVYQGYTFASEELNPLQFRLERGKGYVYVKGRGSVSSPTGKVFRLPDMVDANASSAFARAEFALQDPALIEESTAPDPCPVEVNFSLKGSELKVLPGSKLYEDEREGRWILWCNGARHTWRGAGDIAHGKLIRIESNDTDPLQFRVDKYLGYVYLKGKGSIKTRDGKVIRLPPAEATTMSGRETDGGTDQPRTPSAANGFASKPIVVVGPIAMPNGTLQKVAFQDAARSLHMTLKSSGIGIRTEIDKPGPGKHFLVLFITRHIIPEKENVLIMANENAARIADYDKPWILDYIGNTYTPAHFFVDGKEVELAFAVPTDTQGFIFQVEDKTYSLDHLLASGNSSPLPTAVTQPQPPMAKGTKLEKWYEQTPLQPNPSPPAAAAATSTEPRFPPAAANPVVSSVTTPKQATPGESTGPVLNDQDPVTKAVSKSWHWLKGIFSNPGKVQTEQ